MKLNITAAIIFLVAILGVNFNTYSQNVPTSATPSPPSFGSYFPSFSNMNVLNTKCNYVRVYKNYFKRNTLSTFSNDQPTSTTYKNGFGQPMQTILHGAGDAGINDIIQPFSNQKGYESYQLLSYPNFSYKVRYQTDPANDNYNYYNNKYPDEYGFSLSKQEIDVTGNVATVSVYTAGAEYYGKGVHTKITNKVNDYIGDPAVILTIGSNHDIIYLGGYTNGSLTIKKTESPEDGFVKEYYNKSGQLVLKEVRAYDNTWLKTYYVYNELGKIEYIVPPKAVDHLEVNSWSSTAITAVTGKLCHFYRYDKYGNLVEKRAPDKNGSEYTVYNKYMMPVLTQTPNLAQQGKWLYTIYDSKGRDVISGLISSTDTYSDWESWINGTATPPVPTQQVPIEEYFLHNINNFFDGDYNKSLVHKTGNECEVLSKFYYDFYRSGRSYDPIYNNDYLPVNTEYDPVLVTSNTRGLLTESSIKIMDDNGTAGWVDAVNFYDVHGRVIQIQTKNPWNTNDEWDVLGSQYNFAGDLVYTASKYHTWSACNVPDVRVDVKRDYQFRHHKIAKVHETINGTQSNTLATYSYDRLGRVSAKVIGGVEHQNYEYDLRGRLTAINKDYVNSGAAHNNKTFGEIISYEQGFTNTRKDGSIAGYVWRGAGTSPKRAYGYSYDDAGRMTGADYNEYTTSSWNHTAHDYTVSNLSYDANGNILSMKQRGVPKAPSSSPVDMDKMRYEYFPLTNKLQQIMDTVVQGVDTPYLLNDFIDRHTGTVDYDYDANGNLRTDKNKHIDSIVYNFMDLPEKVYSSMGTIVNTYSADGTLLQKIITPNGQTPIVYRYWGPLVVRNDSMQYFLNEEGRVRYVPATDNYAHDFFVKDHLDNVRSVVNSELATWGPYEEYSADHEVANATFERLLFTNIDGVRSPKPQGTPIDVMAARMNASEPDHVVGTGIILHVMAGDKYSLESYGYYEAATGPDTTMLAEDMASAIITAFSGGAGDAGGGEGGGNPTVDAMFAPHNYANTFDAIVEQATDTAYPRTYLYYMLYDEDLNLLADQSGAIQIGGPPNTWNLMTAASDVSVEQTGFFVAFVGTSTRGRDTWIDKLTLKHYRGRLMEEQHYYPHGLHIEAGGQQNTPMPNEYLHQTKKLQKELGLELYDFHARQYDAQIGRFWGLDPADQFPSGYTGMGNDPANLVDPTGMLAKGTGGIGDDTKNSSDTPENPFDVKSGGILFVHNMNDASLSFMDEAYIGGGGYGEPADVEYEGEDDGQGSSGNIATKIVDFFMSFFGIGMNQDYSASAQAEYANRRSAMSDVNEKIADGAEKLESVPILGTAMTTTKLIQAESSSDKLYAGGQLALSLGLEILPAKGLKFFSTKFTSYGLGPKVYPSLVNKFGFGYTSHAVSQGAYINMSYATKLKQISNVGVWSKVYEAGFLNGSKVEIHYFYNTTTRQYVNPFIHHKGWGKQFK